MVDQGQHVSPLALRAGGFDIGAKGFGYIWKRLPTVFEGPGAALSRGSVFVFGGDLAQLARHCAPVFQQRVRVLPVSGTKRFKARLPDRPPKRAKAPVDVLFCIAAHAMELGL